MGSYPIQSEAGKFVEFAIIIFIGVKHLWLRNTFSPNEIQRSPPSLKRSCYSVGWRKEYEKLKLLNRRTRES